MAKLPIDSDHHQPEGMPADSHPHGKPHDPRHDHCDTHDHEHGHGHSHAPKNFGRAFAIGIVLNISFVIAEVVYGLSAHSLALLADAGHNLSDVLGLALAWGATILARRIPSNRFTYGLRSSSIIAALTNAVLLLVVTGGIAWEAILRLNHPTPVAGVTVMVVAAFGILINGVTAWLFMSGSKGDLNIRGAFLHMASDAVISLGVVVAGGLILFTGWLWLDPAMSLIISMVIVFGTWGLFRDSAYLALHGVPEGIEADQVRAYLESVTGVTEVHDLHIWGMSTTEVALTVHLVIPAGHPGDAVMADLSHALQERFQIGHATIQVEHGDTDEQCKLAPAHLV